MARDYYQVLGVPRDASPEALQKAYRKAAKKWHPDVSKAPDAEARFKEIGEAWEVLKDPEKRAAYDRWGPQWEAIHEGRAAPPGAGGPSFEFDLGDLGSIFEQVMGGRAAQGMGGARPRRAPDQETTLRLGVTEAFRGGARDVMIDGRRLTVTVPAGVRAGQKIRLAGQAARGADLYLVVELVADETFTLSGDDLVTRVEITAPQAVLGTTVEVPTLEGAVRVKVPPGSSSGRKIRLRGRGYPKKSGRGDLHAELAIVVPTELDDEARALWEKLADREA